MQIPLGEFGGRTPQVRQTNIGNVGGGQGQAKANAFSAVTTALEGIATKMLANDRLDAENQLFDYQAGLDDINNQVAELYSTGEIDYKQMPEMRQQLIDKLPAPSFDNLDKLDRKKFLLERKKVLHTNKLSMVKQYGLAMQSAAQSTVDKKVTNADKIVQQPNANLEETANNLFANGDFQQIGQLGYEDGWQPQQNEIYQRLTNTFVQSQMKHASDSGDIKSLQTLQKNLVDDEQFAVLTPLAKKQFSQQIDALIDITAGKTYGKKIVNNFNQLFEKTGDFSAIKAYQAFSSLQNNDSIGTQKPLSIDNAKNLAKAIGVPFDEQRFNDDPQYQQELQQGHFSQALDQYGSPLMATLAMQVGDKKLNQWLQQFGDPNKGQVSEEELIAEIPDKSIKQKMQKISQQLKDSPTDQFDIEASLAAIDNDKSLNSNQKRYAKAEFRQYAENKQQQQQQFYKQVREDVWRDVYVNNIAISEISPEKITSLEKIGGAELFEKKPATTLDFNLLQEARGRLKAGEQVDLIKDYFGKIPNQQLEILLNIQKDIDSNPDKKNRLSQLTATVNSNAKAIGVVNNKVISRLQDIVTEEIETIESNTGRKINQDELQQIMDKQMILAKINSANSITNEDYYQDNSYQRYDQSYITNINEVPGIDQQQIKEALAINDMPVTDELIIKYFNKGLGYV